MCAVCGGGFTLSSRSTLRCFNASARGTCANRRAITREALEARVLTAVCERLLNTTDVAAFCEGYVEATNRLRQEQRVAIANAPQEIAALNRRSDEILSLLLNGFRDDRWKAELSQIESRRREFEALAARKPEPMLALHPHLADVFKRRVEALVAALGEADEGRRAQARDAVRALIVVIKIPPEGLLRVVGDLGAMLEPAAGGDPAVAHVGCGGVQPAVLAAVERGGVTGGLSRDLNSRRMSFDEFRHHPDRMSVGVITGPTVERVIEVEFSPAVFVVSDEEHWLTDNRHDCPLVLRW